MRYVAIACLALAMCGGCTSSDENAPTNLPADAGKISNPTGQLTPEQSQMAGQMKQAGNGIADRMAEAARQEREAKQRTGGK